VGVVALETGHLRPGLRVDVRRNVERTSAEAVQLANEGRSDDEEDISRENRWLTQAIDRIETVRSRS
jgi:hypothetical protein